MCWSSGTRSIASPAHACPCRRPTAPAARSRPPSPRASASGSTCSRPSNERHATCAPRSPPPSRSAAARARSTIVSLAVDKSATGGDASNMGDGNLTPSLLLAMPQLRDPNFTRSVVLLCEHGPDCALGFVVNRPTDVHAAQAVALDPPPVRDSGLRLWTGGPVETSRGFLLLGEDPDVEQSQRVGDGFYITSSMEVLRPLLEAHPLELPQRRCRLLLGYAGWGPGQLDQELAASAWLTAPADPDLVFGTPADEMWETAIRGLGVDPLALQPAPGVQ